MLQIFFFKDQKYNAYPEKIEELTKKGNNGECLKESLYSNFNEFFFPFDDKQGIKYNSPYSWKAHVSSIPQAVPKVLEITKKVFDTIKNNKDNNKVTAIDGKIVTTAPNLRSLMEYAIDPQMGKFMTIYTNYYSENLAANTFKRYFLSDERSDSTSYLNSNLNEMLENTFTTFYIAQMLDSAFNKALKNGELKQKDAVISPGEFKFGTSGFVWIRLAQISRDSGIRQISEKGPLMGDNRWYPLHPQLYYPDNKVLAENIQKYLKEVYSQVLEQIKKEPGYEKVISTHDARNDELPLHDSCGRTISEHLERFTSDQGLSN